MTRRQHQEIYDDLSIKWQEDRLRREQELVNIGKPRVADKVLNFLAGLIIATAVVYIIHHFTH